MKRLLQTLFFCVAISSTITVFAQPTTQLVKVIVGLDHDNWIYQKGETANFSVAVFRNGNLLKDARIRYELGPEKMPATKKETLTILVRVSRGLTLRLNAAQCSLIFSCLFNQPPKWG
jgi:hypothetical protein